MENFVKMEWHAFLNAVTGISVTAMINATQNKDIHLHGGIF